MTIALIGQQKYDFQDLVCAQLILQFYQRPGIQFWVEPKGGEDAMFVFQGADATDLSFEIQIKGSEEHVDFELIAECLGHFPAYKAENFLLERLVNNTNSVCVLVMSGRAGDALQKYIPKGNWNGTIHTKGSFNKEDAQKIIGVINNYADKLSSTAQNIKRQKYIHSYMKSTPLKSIQNALIRLIIIDNVNTDHLSEKCRMALRRNFNIPDDKFHEIMADLIAVVKDGKTSEDDVIPVFLNKLNDKPIVSIEPQNYIKRGQEDEWIDLLTKGNVLLLSGQPRVGKTNTAKWIGAQFQREGYSVLLINDVNEAERYLLDPVNSPRLVVLDDPLGGIHPVEKPYEKLILLKKLITNLRGNRKLIISQGQERLLEVAEIESIEDASLNNNSWIDFSELPQQFLMSLWESLREAYSVKETIFSTVSLALKENNLLIEPGCLVYLAVENHKVPECVDINKLIKFARKDAKDLGLALKAEGFKDILIALAITTGSLERIEKETLSFVLSNTKDKVYGYSKFIGTSWSSDNETANFDFPTYDDVPLLTDEDNRSLESLELRRMIDFDNVDQTTFTHSFYRSMAESLISFATQNSFKEIRQVLNNGLFCLSPITARASARNLQWIYDNATKGIYKDSIMEIAISGLDSSYPSVRDICFEFIVSNFQSLNETQLQNQDSWIYKVSQTDQLHALQWSDQTGEPWYLQDDALCVEMRFESVDEDEIELLINSINNEVILTISAQSAYNLLVYLKREPEKLTSIIMSRILSINEGLIRALAAKIWIRGNHNDDKHVLDRLFSDRHPAVVRSIFTTSINIWEQFDDERQEYFFNGLNELMKHPILASTIMENLVVFERPHLSGENPPWNLFASLLSQALLAQRHDSTLNYARLYNAVQNATTKLDFDSIFPILESWVSLLEAICIKKIPNDYALGITSILMKSTKSNGSHRRDLVIRLLSLHGTGPIVRVISDLMDYWSELTPKEQQKVIALINSNRKDKVWLQAAIITSGLAPSELLQLINTKDTLVKLNVDDVLGMTPSLLEASFKMYIGEPQPLWWIGTHHREKEIWPKVINAIVRNHSHPLFKLAFNTYLNTYDQEILCGVINEISVDGAEIIFELILQQFISSNPEFMPKVWQALFDVAPNDNLRKEWIKRIASNVLCVLDSLLDAKKIIPNEYLDEFYSYFLDDMKLIEFAFQMLEIKKNYSDEIIPKDLLDNLLQIVTSLLNQYMPIHYDTCMILINVLKNIGVPSEKLSFIHEKRKELLKNKSNSSENKESEEISDWIF